MSVAAVRTPAEYESQLRRYLYDRSEEGRAVRVGEKEVSERAEIVARYRDLFSREQLEALHAAEQEASVGEVVLAERTVVRRKDVARQCPAVHRVDPRRVSGTGRGGPYQGLR